MIISLVYDRKLYLSRTNTVHYNMNHKSSVLQREAGTALLSYFHFKNIEQ